MDVGFARLSFSIAIAIHALISLVSRPGRIFAHLLQLWLPATMFAAWIGFAFRGATTGDWTLAGFWAVVLSANILVLWFRTRLFLRVWFITLFVAFAMHPTVACIHYATLRAVHFKTYNECVEADYQALAVILSSVGAFILFLIGRQFANDAFAW